MNALRNLFRELDAEARWNGVAAEVREERRRQDEKWGPQDHEDLPGGMPGGPCYGTLAGFWKDRNDARVETGTLAWDGILLEEVYEALEQGNTDNAALREELIQVAAVATAWVEAIDRRENNAGLQTG